MREQSQNLENFLIFLVRGFLGISDARSDLKVAYHGNKAFMDDKLSYIYQVNKGHKLLRVAGKETSTGIESASNYS